MGLSECKRVIVDNLSCDQAKQVHAALVSGGFKDTGHDGISSIFESSEGPWQVIVRERSKIFITISNGTDLLMSANHFFEDIEGSYVEVCNKVKSICDLTLTLAVS